MATERPQEYTPKTPHDALVELYGILRGELLKMPEEKGLAKQLPRGVRQEGGDLIRLRQDELMRLEGKESAYSEIYGIVQEMLKALDKQSEN